MTAFAEEPGARTQYPERLEKETYAEVHSDHEMAIARLNEDLKYFCFMKIPEERIDLSMGDAEGTAQGLVNLFRTLASEDAIAMLQLLGSGSRNRMQSLPCIARQLSMPMERAKEVIDSFDRLGLVWRVSADITEEPTIIYGYCHSVPLACMLSLAVTVTRYIMNREFYVDTWVKGPYRMEQSAIAQPVPSISGWCASPEEDREEAAQRRTER